MQGFDSPPRLQARVAELVYAHDLKSCLARDVGSMPTPGTIGRKGLDSESSYLAWLMKTQGISGTARASREWRWRFEPKIF